MQSPAAWRIDYPKAADVANTRWWEQFGDPALNGLIETALRDNLDVRVAAARIDQFLGQLTSTNSQAYPQLGYGGAATRTRASREGITPIPAPVSNYFTLYQGALNASWQIDLFGRVRRMSEAAQAQVYASEQGQRGVVLTLVAGIASSYIALRALDRQLEIARATAANFGETERIFNLRFQQRHGVAVRGLADPVAAPAGADRDPDASSSRSRRWRTRSRCCSAATRARSRAARPSTSWSLPLIPAGLPSELLERRPDILAAEQNLVAANASIGVARSLYYPNISLTGALGSTSTSFGDFLSGPATRPGRLIGGLTGPIFTFGAIEGQVRSAEAQKDAGRAGLPADRAGRLPRHRQRAGRRARSRPRASNSSASACARCANSRAWRTSSSRPA